MRYPASEKLEVFRLVERSHLPAKRTGSLAKVLASDENVIRNRILSFGNSIVKCTVNKTAIFPPCG